MIERQVDDSVLSRGQSLAELGFPDLPRVFPPEVVGPEKSTFEDVVAKRTGLAVVEVCTAGLGHHEERAAEQLGLSEPDEYVIWTAAFVDADGRPGQL